MENLKLRKEILNLKKALVKQQQQNQFYLLFLEEIQYKVTEKWGADEYNRILSEIKAESDKQEAG